MANKTTILVLFSLLFITVILSEDLKIGTASNSELAYVENVKLSGIPHKTRTKNVWYNDQHGRVIKAIAAIGGMMSDARARVTVGGVGSSFVNIKIKSEVGEGLDYIVQIFV